MFNTQLVKLVPSASCSSSPVRAEAVHPAVLPVTFVVIALVERLTGSDEFTKATQTKIESASGACCHGYVCNRADLTKPSWCGCRSSFRGNTCGF